MTVINGATPTTFEVAPDGSMVSIHVADRDFNPGSLVLPAECVQAMIMTLPEMMRLALTRQYRDPSLRVVYPVDGWRLECSTQPGKFIPTLTTVDGFSVSFAVDSGQIAGIAQAAAMPDFSAPPRPH